MKKHKDKIANLEQEIHRLREHTKAVSAERDDFQKKGLELTNIAKEKIRVAEEENNKLKVISECFEKSQLFYQGTTTRNGKILQGAINKDRKLCA